MRPAPSTILAVIVTCLLATSPASAGLGDGIDDGFAGRFDRATSGSAAGRSALAARTAVSRAQHDFRLIGYTLEQQLKQSSDWQFGVIDVMAARRRVNAIRQPVIQTVRDGHAWRQTQMEIEQVERELNATRDRHPRDPNILTLANRLLALRQSNSQREALAIQENADLPDAQADLLAASETLRDMWDRELGNLTSRQDWRHAKMSVAAAKDRLVTAQAALDRERRQQAATEHDRLVATRVSKRSTDSAISLKTQSR